jgi:hypothetical protein
MEERWRFRYCKFDSLKYETVSTYGETFYVHSLFFPSDTLWDTPFLQCMKYLTKSIITSYSLHLQWQMSTLCLQKWSILYWDVLPLFAGKYHQCWDCFFDGNALVSAVLCIYILPWKREKFWMCDPMQSVVTLCRLKNELCLIMWALFFKTYKFRFVQEWLVLCFVARGTDFVKWEYIYIRIYYFSVRCNMCVVIIEHFITTFQQWRKSVLQNRISDPL